MIKVALPNKGQLFEPTMDMLSACGYKVNKSLRSLSTLDSEHQIEFYFLRPGDIPVYVANGLLDAGITGKDFVAEKGVSPVHLLDLNYAHSKLCAAVPAEKAKGLMVKDLKHNTIATSFVNITRQFFGGHDNLVELEGAVEISIKLGIADAIIDIVETGTTLKQAGLEIIGEPLFHSQAALYAHPGRELQAEILVLKNRLEGKLLASAYMMVEYDCPASLLHAACQLTPGIESPTVIPLQNKEWLSIKAMIRKKEAHHKLDELAKLGCKGIILMSIESARI